MPPIRSAERFPLVGADETFVEVERGVDLRVVDHRADRSKPPEFLLVHGLASNARMWDGVAAELRDRDLGSIAVDLRGHGRSSKPDHGYDFDTVCHDLTRVLDHFDTAGAVFVGQSWGGNVVIHAARHHPDRVRAAVPVDGGMIELGRSFDSWDECERALRPPALAGMRAGRLEAAIRSTNGDWPETGIVGILSNFEELPDGTVRPWLTLERHLAILRELWSHRPSDLYGDIEPPVLFLPADSGDVAWTRNKERAVEHALSRLKRGRVHWFRPAHHDVHAQHPRRVAEVLADSHREGFLS